MARSTTARFDSNNYTSLVPASFREFAGIGRAAQLAIAPEFHSTNILANSAANHPSGGCLGRDKEVSKKLAHASNDLSHTGKPPDCLPKSILMVPTNSVKKLGQIQSLLARLRFFAGSSCEHG